MALIKCRECEREISSTATVCPGCGAPVKARTTFSKGWIVLIGILVLLVLVWKDAVKKKVEEEARDFAKEWQQPESVEARKELADAWKNLKTEVAGPPKPGEIDESFGASATPAASPTPEPLSAQDQAFVNTRCQKVCDFAV